MKKGDFLAKLLITIVAFLSVSISAFSSDTFIRVRVSDFPPQYYLDNTGRWTGLDVELANAIINEAGFKAKYVLTSWSAGLRHIEDGTLDLMMNMSITAERSRYTNWIGPARKTQMVLVVNEANQGMAIKELDDFINISQAQKIRFGLQDNLHYSDAFNDKLKNPQFNNSFEIVKNEKMNPRKVIANRILGFFEDKISMTYRVKNDPNYKGLVVHPFILREEDVYFGISKKTSLQAYKKLLQAFEKLQQDGTLQSIRARY